MITVEMIATNTPRRDYVGSISKPSHTVIGSKIFFAGGLDGNNISRKVWYYDSIIKEVVRLPDFINESLNPVIVKDNDSICIIDKNKTLYRLESYQWVKKNTLDISGESYICVSTKEKQYIVTDGSIYEYVDNGLIEVYEDERIQPLSYIPSSDKNIIHFENGFYSIESNKFTPNDQAEYSYIIYGEGYYDYDVIIDKEKSLLFYYDHNTQTMFYKTFSSDYWHKDEFKKSLPTLPRINDIVYENDLYFTTIDSTIHCAFRYDILTNTSHKLYSIKRENVSYSKNIKFNHASSKAIRYKDTIAIVGDSGYYKDNNEYDNSVYVGNKIIPLQLNIEAPMYDYYNGTICIADKATDSIYLYDDNGKFLNRIAVPIENQVDSFKYYSDRIIFNSQDKTYSYDTNKREVTYVINDHALVSCTDKFFRYAIAISNNDNVELNVTSIMSNRKRTYKLDLSIEGHDRYIMDSTQGKLIFYKEKNNNWDIHRIIFDE